MDKPCPSCGFCPTCGRRNAAPVWYPSLWISPYTWIPWTAPIYTTSTSDTTSIGITTVTN